jgi:hypothetical protein
MSALAGKLAALTGAGAAKTPTVGRNKTCPSSNSIEATKTQRKVCGCCRPDFGFMFYLSNQIHLKEVLHLS